MIAVLNFFSLSLLFQSFSHSNDFLFFTYRDFPIYEEFLIKEFNLFTFFEKLVVVW